jgi:hypothetical protein
MIWSITIFKNLGDPTKMELDKVPVLIFLLFVSGSIFAGIGYVAGFSWEAFRLASRSSDE